MLAEFGYGVLVLSFIVTMYSGVAAVFGVRKKSASLIESARRAQLLSFPLISISSLALIYLLVNNHFEVTFVYEVTSLSMPTYLKITAFGLGYWRHLLL
jgi:cytochrome c-type biogenesis protein CcmF